MYIYIYMYRCIYIYVYVYIYICTIIYIYIYIYCIYILYIIYIIYIYIILYIYILYVHIIIVELRTPVMPQGFLIPVVVVVVVAVVVVVVVVVCWLLVVGCWLLVVGCWLLVVVCWWLWLLLLLLSLLLLLLLLFKLVKSQCLVHIKSHGWPLVDPWGTPPTKPVAMEIHGWRVKLVKTPQLPNSMSCLNGLNMLKLCEKTQTSMYVACFKLDSIPNFHIFFLLKLYIKSQVARHIPFFLGPCDTEFTWKIPFPHGNSSFPFPSSGLVKKSQPRCLGKGIGVPSGDITYAAYAGFLSFLSHGTPNHPKLDIRQC